MKKEPLAELTWKRKVYEMWKKGQATWEEYRNVVKACRDAIRKAKVHLELKLTRDVKNNKKGFFNYISSKWKTRDNMGMLLNKVGVLVMEDTEKVELPNNFFASVFSAKAGPQESQALEVRGNLQKGRTLGRAELCERSSKQFGHPQIHGPRWNAPTSTRGAGRGRC